MSDAGEPNPVDPRSLLSHDEIRELFSPLAGPGGGDPVLVLTDRPEDAEAVQSDLRERGIAVVYALSRYAAIDFFRQRSYQAVVSSPEAWGENPAKFLDRFRAVDPSVRFFFICDPGQAIPIPDALRLERPLEPPLAPLGALAVTEEIDVSLPVGAAPDNANPEAPPSTAVTDSEAMTSEAMTSARTPTHSGSQAENGAPLHGRDEAPSTRWPETDTATRAEAARPPGAGSNTPPGGAEEPTWEPASLSSTGDDSDEDPVPQHGGAGRGFDLSGGETAPVEPPGRRRPRPVTPDPLGGVQALLEARRDGLEIAEGLRMWAARDRAIFGVLHGRTTETDVSYRCWTDNEERRAEMMQAAVTSGLVAQRPVAEETPRSQGQFLVFPDADAGGWLALWLRVRAHGDQLAERMSPLLDLLRSIGSSATPPREDPRHHFLRLLRSRMKLCERRDSVLGVMVAQAFQPSEVSQLHKAIRGALRESDWTDEIGNRVYCLLEQPRRGVGQALEDRLGLNGSNIAVRVVGKMWSPRGVTEVDATAESLLCEVEESFDEPLLESGFVFEEFP